MVVHLIVHQIVTPLFELGTVYGTPGAVEQLEKRGIPPEAYIARHVTGDWGDLDEGDRAENEFAVTRELRLLSAYQIDEHFTLWIITEADRSATTLLRPDEY